MQRPVQIILTRNLYSRKCYGDAIYCDSGSGWMKRGETSIHVPKAERRIILSLLAHSPGFVSKDHLIDVVWGDRSDGGPDHAEQQIHAHLLMVRDFAAAFGFVIESIPKHGWRVYRKMAIAAE